MTKLNVRNPPRQVPRVSVLIPTYNRRDLVLRAIRSAQEQTEESIEIIVSDNCSTDDTVVSLKKICVADSRVKLIEQTSNRGPILNWMSCLEAAGSDYVLWLWSDDWLEPDAVETLLESSEKNENHPCPSMGMARVWSSGDTFGDSYGFAKPRLSPPELMGYLLRSLAPASPACCLIPTKSARRHFYGHIRLLSLTPTRFGFGTDVLMIVGSSIEAGGLLAIPKVVVNFTSHAQTLTSAKARWCQLYYFASYAWLASRLPSCQEAVLQAVAGPAIGRKRRYAIRFLLTVARMQAWRSQHEAQRGLSST